jgi:hypothetical protein
MRDHCDGSADFFMYKVMLALGQPCRGVGADGGNGSAGVAAEDADVARLDTLRAGFRMLLWPVTLDGRPRGHARN